MTPPRHHVPADLIVSYSVGALPAPFAVVLATHISLCDDCRAEYEAASIPGGLMLDEHATASLSDGFRERVMAALDAPAPLQEVHSSQFPAPLHEALGRQAPHWRKIAPGSRQAILQNDAEGSLRLLEFPALQAVPEHSHRGQEMTLVLRGSFSDITGTYTVGDVQLADPTLEHAPVADAGMPCLCLAATDAPLRFRGLVPRLLQPLLRI